MADYTPISILRGNSTIIDSTPIVDGQILFDETRKCLFMDNGSTREKYSGLGADSNIANVEDTTTASQPYTTGEFVVVEGQLYKVTASIATGDTFSVGTNIETDIVGSEITKINNDISNKYDVTFESYASGTAENKIQQIGDNRYFIAFAVNTTSIMASGDHIFGSIDSSLPTGLLVVFDSVTGRANQGYVDSNRKIHVKLVNPDGIAASTQLSVLGLLYE